MQNVAPSVPRVQEDLDEPRTEKKLYFIPAADHTQSDPAKLCVWWGLLLWEPDVINSLLNSASMD